jgi:hypothetical protein
MYYPFELNSLEAGTLSVVTRILQGKSIYVEPSLEYVPFTFAPLYYFLAGIVGKLSGLGFAPLRLVSFVSGLFCLGLIYLFVKHDTKNRFLGLVSAGLFAAFYNISGGWLDMGAGDSLSLLFLLSALYILRFYRNSKSYLVTGVLLFLAFFSGQYSVIILIFVLVYGLIYNRKIILPILVTAIPLIVASVWLMDRFYDNWFSFYIIDLPLGREISTSSIILFWTEGLLRNCVLPVGFVLCNLALNFKAAWKNPGWGFNLLAGAGMILISWIMQLKVEYGADALLPAYAMITIIFGVSASDILKKFKSPPGSNGHRLPEIVYILFILQFVSLIYDPRWLIPSAADKAAGREFVENISRVEGDVFIPSHGYLGIMAGKNQYASASAMIDVLENGGNEVAENLKEEISSAFADKKFAAVVYDNLNSPIGKLDLDKDYAFDKLMFADNQVFFPVSGTRTRPQFLFAPINPPVIDILGPVPSAPEEE